MTASRFVRYQLRTTDPEAARGFYAGVVGGQIWGPDVEAGPLAAAALVRGARPHWLGHIGVTDVETTMGRLAAQGARQLGPDERTADGCLRVALRDPFGAIVALQSGPAPVSRGQVVWHALSVADHRPAFAAYSALFGWQALDEVTFPEPVGKTQLFGWDQSGKAVGSVAESARFAGVHEHWMFFFHVRNVAAAVAQARARGGLANEPMPTPRGDLVAACDDPQGAAFGLYQIGS